MATKSNSKWAAALVPDLPTVAESGVPAYESTAWFILLAPAKTPPAIAERLNADVVAVLHRPESFRSTT